MEDIIDIIVTETTNLIEITSQPTDEVIDVNIIDNREDITLNVTPSVVEININQLTGNFGILWGEIEGTLSNQTDLQNALNLKADLVDGKVPSSQLPSYVDDIVEVATYSALPAIGETGKIYVVLDTNLIYRWSGSAYIEIKDSSAVWGAITGTLSSQTDLQSALDAKLSLTTAASTYVPYTGATTNVVLGTNDLTSRYLVANGGSALGGVISIKQDATYLAKGNGYSSIASSGVMFDFFGYTGASTYKNFSLRFDGLTDNTLRTYTLPNTSGTLALTSDLHNAVTIGTANGLSLSTQVLSLGLASSSTNGALSSTDWTTFNNKQNALTNPVTGTGTTNYVPKFTTTSVLSDSNIQDSGSLITLGSNSYVNGALGIGTSSLTGYNLLIQKDITGATSSFGIHQSTVIRSAVTSAAYVNSTNVQVENVAFTLPILVHYRAAQNTFGASATITNQYGFSAESTLTGATNNYGFYGGIAAGTNRWNIYMAGTANNYMAGSLGIGSTTLTGYNLRISKTITGATTTATLQVDGQIQSDVTGSAILMSTNPTTIASAFTLTNLFHYRASQGTIGSGSTVTNQYGFFVDSTLIGATNDYGFYGNLAAATNNWNIYMNGTANNYLAGSLGIGNTSLTGYNLRISKNITGAVSSYGSLIDGAIQSDVTSQAYYYQSYGSTQNTAFTLSQLGHFYANGNASFGSATVTTQTGFWAGVSLTGATTNYGFRGQLASATGRWNLYMDGTANNYLAGNLLIGSTADNTFRLQVTGSTSISAGLQVGGTINQTFGGSSRSSLYLDASRYAMQTVSGYSIAFEPGATERMRITDTGNVGIGTTAPQATLSIKGAANNTVIEFENGGATKAFMRSYDRSAGTYREYEMLAETLLFSTGSSPSERMRITSDGRLLVGTTTTYDARITCYGENSSSSNFTFRAVNTNGQGIFSVRNDGQFRTGDGPSSPYNLTVIGRAIFSDSTGVLGYVASVREAKTNINSLENVSWIYELNPVSFNYRKKDFDNNYTEEFNSEISYGLIADEVEKVNSDLVFYDNVKGKKQLRGVEYEKLVPALVKVVQELKAELDTLKNK